LTITSVSFPLSQKVSQLVFRRKLVHSPLRLATPLHAPQLVGCFRSRVPNPQPCSPPPLLFGVFIFTRYFLRLFRFKENRRGCNASYVGPSFYHLLPFFFTSLRRSVADLKDCPLPPQVFPLPFLVLTLLDPLTSHGCTKANWIASDSFSLCTCSLFSFIPPETPPES